MTINPFDQFDSFEENPEQKISEQKNPFDQFDNIDLVNTPNPDAPDFIPGVQRGLQNLQASLYGAGALAGGGLKKLGADSAGQKLQDIGMEGYRRNIEEAKQYPKKHSFKDIYTGKTGIGGAVDWLWGTAGELIPSVVEAAAGAAVGSAIGGAGVGTVAGGLAGRTVLKKGIEKIVQQAMKQGVGKRTEAEIREQVTKQALKKFGGKAGIGAAVMPMESGGMYADLLEEKGIDAPKTALFFGAVATSFEFFGGNSKLVDTFVNALSNGSKGLVKKSAKEILTNIPQESLQEGGQELMGILNTVVNTDEKLLTWENVEKIVESMAVGAVGGGMGAVVQTGMSSQVQDPGPERTEQEIEIDRRASNILTQDKELIGQSIQKLNDSINANQELLDDPQKFDDKVKELNVDPEQLAKQILDDNNDNKNLLAQINAGLTEQNKITQEEVKNLSPEEKAVQDALDKLDAQREINNQESAEEVQESAEEVQESAEEVQETEEQDDITQTPDQSTDPQSSFIDEPQVEEVAQVDKINQQREGDILNNGEVYKAKKPLEKKLSTLPNAENYEIIKTPDGFVGRRIPGTVKLNEIMIKRNAIIEEGGKEVEVEFEMPADVALVESDSLIENLYAARGCIS